MAKQTEILSIIIKQGVLPLFFHPSEEISVQVLRALYDAGIRAVEYTNRGEAALANFKAMRRLCDEELKDMYLGIGTIKSPDMAHAFIDAGANYLISPVFDPAVADVAYMHKVLWVPGCMTPTEIHEAEKAGCQLIKLFPGNVLGPGFVSAIKELFPRLQFMPTGGVELEESNLRAWFDAGVAAVGMGSKLITKKILQEQDYHLLQQNTAEIQRIIRAIKGI